MAGVSKRGQLERSTTSEDEMDDIYDYPPVPSPPPAPERRDQGVADFKEEEKNAPIASHPPPSARHKQALSHPIKTSGWGEIQPPHTEDTQDVDKEEEEGNIYDIPSESIKGEPRMMEHGHTDLPNVYDELAKKSIVPLDAPNQESSQAISTLSRAAMQGHDKVRNELSTSLKKRRVPGRQRNSSQGSAVPLSSYGDAGPITEHHSQQQNGVAIVTEGASSPTHRHQHLKKADSVPLPSQHQDENSALPQENAEVFHMYGKVTNHAKERRPLEPQPSSDRPPSSEAEYNTLIGIKKLSSISVQEEEEEVEDEEAVYDTVAEIDGRSETRQPVSSSTHQSQLQISQAVNYDIPERESQSREIHNSSNSKAPPLVPTLKPKPKIGSKQQKPPLQDPHTNSFSTAPVPARRIRTPSNPPPVTKSPGPVPKPRRHMTDSSTLPPSSSSPLAVHIPPRSKSHSLERKPDFEVHEEQHQPMEQDSPHTLNRRKPPAVAPKPPSPDFHSRSLDAPPSPGPKVGPKPTHHSPVVGPKPKPKLGPPPVSPKTIRHRNTMSMFVTGSSPPLPPKPATTFSK